MALADFCSTDVDDLDHVDLIESYLERSSTMLLFLSKGYFQSLNCLREVHATLCLQKHYLLVQEAYTEKGGAPIAELKLELQDKTFRDQVFDGRPVTVWYRVSHLQCEDIICTPLPLP